MSNKGTGDIVLARASSQVSAVLFACNVNAVRSAMAEAMVKHAFPGEIFVDSCGVTPGAQDGFAAAVMHEIGIDMSAHEPKSFDDLESGFYDVIISFSSEAHDVARALTQNIDCEPLYWPVDNLANLIGSRDEMLRAYRHVRDDISDKLSIYFGKEIAGNT